MLSLKFQTIDGSLEIFPLYAPVFKEVYRPLSSRNILIQYLLRY